MPTATTRVWLAIGAVLLVVLLVWAQVSAAVAGGSAGPFSWLLISCAGAYGIGFLAGRRWAFVVAATVGVGVALAFVLSPGSFSGRPLAAPLHYGNANGALAAVGAAACALLATRLRPAALRWVTFAVAASFVAVAVATRSQAGAIAALVVIVVVALALVTRRTRALALAVPVAVAAVALASIALGAAHRQGAETQPSLVHQAERALSERRVALWHDALVLTADHPVVGVGPGRFAEESPVARSDTDTAWAHSGWLQQSAEQGLVGLLLLGGLVVWAWLPLLAAARSGSVTAVAGSAALGALLLCAGVDYVLHFAVLPILAAALVATATKSATIMQRCS